MSLLCISPVFSEVKSAKVSWYSVASNGGTKTASGARFKDNSNMVAHKTLPFGTVVQFVHPETGKTEIGVIRDRGPYVKSREFDLAKGLASKLGFLKTGVTTLHYKILHKP